MNKAESNTLAVCLQKGDSTAGAKIFDEFFPQIFRFLMARLSHRETAQDLAQEVFLKLVEKIGSFDPVQGDFAPWLWQITRNSLIDFFRQKKPQYLADMEREGDNIPDPMNYIGSHAELREVLDIVKNLSPEDQELFQMYFVSDLSYADMAKVTEKTESNLRVAIHRIRQKIIKQHKND